MTRCSYAACTMLARVTLDDWDFCRDHAIAHQSEAVGAVYVERPATHVGPIDRTEATHGTVRAYHRHRRARETPCEPCKTANANAERLRRERARKAAA